MFTCWSSNKICIYVPTSVGIYIVLWVGHFEQLTSLWTDEGFDSYFAVYINLRCGSYNAPDVNSVESTFGLNYKLRF